MRAMTACSAVRAASERVSVRAKTPIATIEPAASSHMPQLNEPDSTSAASSLQVEQHGARRDDVERGVGERLAPRQVEVGVRRRPAAGRRGSPTRTRGSAQPATTISTVAADITSANDQTGHVSATPRRSGRPDGDRDEGHRRDDRDVGLRGVRQQEPQQRQRAGSQEQCPEPPRHRARVDVEQWPARPLGQEQPLHSSHTICSRVMNVYWHETKAPRGTQRDPSSLREPPAASSPIRGMGGSGHLRPRCDAERGSPRGQGWTGAGRRWRFEVHELTDELMAVVVLAAEHAIDSVRDGGPLVPFVLSESELGTRRLQRILIGSPTDLSTSIARARALAGRRAGEEAVVACAYAGQLGTGPDAQHAIFVEAREGSRAGARLRPVLPPAAPAAAPALPRQPRLRRRGRAPRRVAPSPSSRARRAAGAGRATPSPRRPGRRPAPRRRS